MEITIWLLKQTSYGNKGDGYSLDSFPELLNRKIVHNGCIYEFEQIVIKNNQMDIRYYSTGEHITGMKESE